MESAVVPERTPPASPGAGSRLVAIDAARGTAMLFVFLAHFADVYLAPLEALARTRRALGFVTLLASPTFIALSGLMLGWLFASLGARFEQMRIKLMDRGLFLLSVGHLLIALSYAWLEPNWHVVFITDAIAVSIIAGPLVVRRLAPRGRVLLGAALFALAWAVSVAWAPPSASVLRFVEYALFGTALPWGFPLLPWFAVYLVATALGETLHGWQRRGDLVRPLLRLVAGLVLAGLVAEGVHWWLKDRGGAGPWLQALRLLTSVSQKHPPALAYFLFYGGLGLGGLALLVALEQAGRAAAWLRWTALLGRHSLFAFILQNFVYYALLGPLHLPASGWWPAWFATSVLLLFALVRGWDALDGGRFLTVGYTALRRARAGATRPLAAVGAPGQPRQG